MSERTERISLLHRQAMSIYEKAKSEALSESMDKSVRLYERAAAAEAEAAKRTTNEDEPSRSVLHRSAAWLFIDAKRPVNALEIAVRGLTGTLVPPEIAAELIGVAERALEIVKKERGLV